MWLIVGLGNPGSKYELTRHNFGFLVTDALLDQGISPGMQQGLGGTFARLDLNGEKCLVLKPQTFMNRSGDAVLKAMAFHKIPLDNVIVIHDDLDLPLGKIRVKQGGGNGGHNGLKDISQKVGQNFFRIRLGIGRPNLKGTEATYVLSRFNEVELGVVEQVMKKACQVVSLLILKGIDRAQKNLNE